MARLTAFSRQVQLFNDQLQGEFRRQALVTLAKTSLAEAEAHNAAILGRKPAHTTIVDGRQNAAEATVKPGGTIVYLFEVGAASLEGAIDQAFRLLIQQAPYRSKRSGANPATHYRDVFLLFQNGDRRDFADLGRAVTFAPADEIWITNLQPYSRKLERGWSDQAPNGIFEVVTAVLRAKYGSVLNVKFSYRQFSGFGLGRTLRGGTPKTRSEVRRSESYPTIVLTVK